MALVKLWAGLAPWAKCLAAAVSGATVIVGAPLVFADILAIASGGVVQWPTSAVLWRTWLAAAVVVGTAYWAHSPKGREVWTDEQKAAMKDLKEGKL